MCSLLKLMKHGNVKANYGMYCIFFNVLEIALNACLSISLLNILSKYMNLNLRFFFLV